MSDHTPQLAVGSRGKLLREVQLALRVPVDRPITGLTTPETWHALRE